MQQVRGLKGEAQRRASQLLDLITRRPRSSSSEPEAEDTRALKEASTEGPDESAQRSKVKKGPKKSPPKSAKIDQPDVKDTSRVSATAAASGKSHIHRKTLIEPQNLQQTPAASKAPPSPRQDVSRSSAHLNTGARPRSTRAPLGSVNQRVTLKKPEQTKTDTVKVRGPSTRRVSEDQRLNQHKPKNAISTEDLKEFLGTDRVEDSASVVQDEPLTEAQVDGAEKDSQKESPYFAVGRMKTTKTWKTVEIEEQIRKLSIKHPGMETKEMITPVKIKVNLTLKQRDQLTYNQIKQIASKSKMGLNHYLKTLNQYKRRDSWNSWGSLQKYCRLHRCRHFPQTFSTYSWSWSACRNMIEAAELLHSKGSRVQTLQGFAPMENGAASDTEDQMERDLTSP